MKLRTIILAAGLFVCLGARAAGGGGELEHANINLTDTASLQRGAALFINYCMGCHSAQYLRYNRLAQDLDLTEEQVESHLLFGDREISDYMLTAMDADQAEEWFGITPPDLTLTARSRGPDWVYTFLKSFYLTEDGWNNTVLPNAAMPHVLWELQGSFLRRTTRAWLATWSHSWNTPPSPPGSSASRLASGCCCSWPCSRSWPGCSTTSTGRT